MARDGVVSFAALEELEVQRQITPDHTIYVGDGSSDLYVMHHVNSRAGHTIAVSETKSIGRIAQRTVLMFGLRFALGIIVVTSLIPVLLAPTFLRRTYKASENSMRPPFSEFRRVA